MRNGNSLVLFAAFSPARHPSVRGRVLFFPRVFWNMAGDRRDHDEPSTILDVYDPLSFVGERLGNIYFFSAFRRFCRPGSLGGWNKRTSLIWRSRCRSIDKGDVRHFFFRVEASLNRIRVLYLCISVDKRNGRFSCLLCINKEQKNGYYEITWPRDA